MSRLPGLSGWPAILAVLLLGGGWTTALAVNTFTAHMAAHVLAVAVAAPLLVIGGARRPRWLTGAGAMLTACAVEFVVVWGWHVPWLHAAARAEPSVFVLEQLSFVAAGYAVWASALPTAARARSAGLPGAGALLLTSMHMTLLGGLLAVAPGTLYAHAHASDALWDQQLGGIIMMTVGGLAYLTGALWVLGRALVEAPQRRPLT